MVNLAAFPKCFLDDIIVHKTMSLFDWIDKAGELGVDGLEMHHLFFEGKEASYLDAMKRKCADHHLSMPMMCFSPDFTQPVQASQPGPAEKAPLLPFVTSWNVPLPANEP